MSATVKIEEASAVKWNAQRPDGSFSGGVLILPELVDREISAALAYVELTLRAQGFTTGTLEAVVTRDFG